MHHIGIDVHKRESQICILEGKEVLLEQRVRTDRGRFAEVLGERPKARILIEASTESEWVARCLEGLGHEVIVADPNFAPMYATRSRKVKTDRRDARTLAEACALGAYRPAHRTSDEQRHVRAQLAVREVLVRTRSKSISLCRALLRQQGYSLASGAPESFVRRVRALSLPETTAQALEPLLELLEHLNLQLEQREEELAQQVEQCPAARRLCSMSSIGPVTALAFVAAIDDARRFRNAHQVQSYLGLVPREHSSGEKQRKGAITKAGSSRVRSLLVQAAHGLLRLRKAQTQPLWLWAERIVGRRGKQVAVVALARRIAGILWAMMRDEAVYNPRHQQQNAEPQQAA